MSADKLAQLIRSLDRDRLLQMAKKARALGKPEAARVVAQRCMEIAR
jgi:UDP-N-acetylglucosamine--N-acetylmuramyl-(pentapeptide) pyrophosphoryl-undecaprenol N-acetylglucosamine transferase